MRLPATLKNIFAVRPDERADIRSLFFQSFFIGMATSFYFVATYSYLVKNTSVANLPFAYIISGATGFVLMWIYKKIQANKGLLPAVIVSTIAFAVLSLLIYFSFIKWENAAGSKAILAFAGFAFIFPFGAIFSLNLSSVFLSIFDLSQSKRLIALMGIGETIASIISYFIAPLLTTWLHSASSLLLLASMASLMVFIPFRDLMSRHKTNILHKYAGGKNKKVDLGIYLKNRFYLLIAVVTLLSGIAVYFIDYSYLVSVRFMAKESGLEVAGIIAIFFGIVKLGELIFSLLSGNIISSRGMQFSLLLLPLLLAGSAGLAFGSALILPGIVFFLLGFLLLNKWIDRVIRKSIEAPAMRILYQAAGPNERIQLQANNEGMVNQLSTALAGVILWLLTFGSIDNTLVFLGEIALLCVVSFSVWAFFTSRVYLSYKEQIRNYLLKAGSAISENAALPASAEQGFVSALAGEEDPVFMENLEKTYKGLHTLTKTKIVELLSSLDYSLQALLEVKEEEILLKRLVKIYYDNDNYFCRLLILLYFEKLPQLAFIKYAHDLMDVSGFQFKYEILKRLNNLDYKPAETSTWTRLAESCAAEITWLDSAIEDLESENYGPITKELDRHKQFLYRLMFETLEMIYDKNSIRAISDIIIGAPSRENQLFALELLEITLQPPLKELLIKVFDPAPLSARKAKLQNFMPVYSYSPEKRLKDIVMKDFNLVDPYLKQLALEAYYEATHDDSLLSALENSSLKSLAEKAQVLAGKFNGKAMPEVSLLPSLKNLLQPHQLLLYNTWSASRNRPKVKARRGAKAAPNATNSVDIDLFSLALLMAQNQSLTT